MMTVLPKTNPRTRSRRGKKRTRNLRNENNNRIEMDRDDDNDDNDDDESRCSNSMSDIEINDIEMSTSSPRGNLNHECIIPPISAPNSPSSNFNFNDNNINIPGIMLMDTDINSNEEDEEEIEFENETRTFHFNIDNDENLRNIIETNVNDINIDNNGMIGNDIQMLSHINNINNNGVIGNIENINEWTSDYILSKLYNYMKISEMSKYGISVFKMTFSSYLPYLYESDLLKLATSYWCNGQHFACMISHRDHIIKPNENTKLKLKITSDLLDSAMQSGASVDKIEAMLIQKRIDDGIIIKNKINKNKNKNILINNFYQTKYEKDFYLRNLKHRFWNHEVLVRVFIQNGWLTANLADIAMKAFIKTVYYRTLQSKYSFVNKQRNNREIKFSENFLHSFFVSYFCLDDIPKMYKKQILNKINNTQNKNNNECFVYLNLISAETLRRWCELVELLASRGANINEYEFRKIIPLQYALNLGKNTYKIISYSHKIKNQLFIPEIYYQNDIYIPDDVWNILVSYL